MHEIQEMDRQVRRGVGDDDAVWDRAVIQKWEWAVPRGGLRGEERGGRAGGWDGALYM